MNSIFLSFLYLSCGLSSSSSLSWCRTFSFHIDSKWFFSSCFFFFHIIFTHINFVSIRHNKNQSVFEINFSKIYSSHNILTFHFSKLNQTILWSRRQIYSIKETHEIYSCTNSNDTTMPLRFGKKKKKIESCCTNVKLITIHRWPQTSSCQQ